MRCCHILILFLVSLGFYIPCVGAEDQPQGFIQLERLGHQLERVADALEEMTKEEAQGNDVELLRILLKRLSEVEVRLDALRLKHGKMVSIERKNRIEIEEQEEASQSSDAFLRDIQESLSQYEDDINALERERGDLGREGAQLKERLGLG